ncbi:MAG: hypothetical protein ACYSVY_25260 [Planctomycetota bacterium]|jgi:hypothetical protein
MKVFLRLLSGGGILTQAITQDGDRVIGGDLNTIVKPGDALLGVVPYEELSELGAGEHEFDIDPPDGSQV